MSVWPVSPAERVRVVSPWPPATIPPGLVTVPLSLTTRTGVRFADPGASTYWCQSGDAGQEGSGPPIVTAAPAAAGVMSSAAAATTLAPAASARRRYAVRPAAWRLEFVMLRESSLTGLARVSRVAEGGGNDVAGTGHIPVPACVRTAGRGLPAGSAAPGRPVGD